jgi:hypothetical protein
VFFLETELLLATQQLFGGRSSISSPVESNHWQKEVENMHNISLAAMQHMVVGHANPADHRIRDGDSTRNHIVKETTPYNQYLCDNQIVRRTTYTSFKMSKLVFIIVLGGLLSIIANTLPDCVSRWGKRTRTGRAANMDWHQSDTLQLQRHTFEAAGAGPWLNKEGGIPVTAAYGQKFTMPSNASKYAQGEQSYQLLGRQYLQGDGSTEQLKAPSYVYEQPYHQDGYASKPLHQNGWQQPPQQPGYAYQQSYQ